jgi:hypothetical protein
MSSFIKNIYKIGSPRSYIKEIAKIFAMYRSIQEQPDDQKFRTYLRNKVYRLLFNERVGVGTLPINRIDDKFPFEPDGQYVTMMFTFDLALSDQSGFGNHAFHQFTNNQPQYVPNGGFLGGEGSSAPSDLLPFSVAFNWDLTYNVFNVSTHDKFWIPFSQSNQIVYDTTTGFSVFMRIYPFTFDFQTEGYDSTPALTAYGRRLWSKMDDLDNGAQAYLRTGSADPNEGVIVFCVRKNGIEYEITNNVLLPAFNWYDVWFTFNYATNTPLIWVNSVSYNTPQADAMAWNNTHSDWIIGNWNFDNAKGNFVGVIDDFRFYRNKIVTSTEIGRMYANKLTITDIQITEFAGVFIIGKSRFGPGTGTGPAGNDYVDADYVDADYIVTGPVIDSFEDGSFDTGAFA